MATENNTQAQSAADAPRRSLIPSLRRPRRSFAKARPPRPASAPPARAAPSCATASVKTAKTATRRKAKATRSYTRRAAAQAAAVAKETISTMTNRNISPASTPFRRSLRSRRVRHVGDRARTSPRRVAAWPEGRRAVRRSDPRQCRSDHRGQRVAANGVRTIGQDVVATSRDGIEQPRTRSAACRSQVADPNICSCRAISLALH